MSGQHLEKSGKQQLSAFAMIAIGGAVSYFGSKEGNNNIITAGGVVSAISIPLFISSAINKRKAGEKMKEFNLINSKNNAPNLSNSNTTETSDSTTIPKTVTSSLLKINQMVFFYKNGELTEGKVTLVDSIGARIEYFDQEKKKIKSKYFFRDKIFVEKPQ
mgnify:CR=1 FL=1